MASLMSPQIKNPPANAGDTVSNPGLGRYPGEENDDPLQYFCLKNPKDSGAWRAIVHEVTKSQTRLIDSACLHMCALEGERMVWQMKWCGKEKGKRSEFNRIGSHPVGQNRERG